MTATSESDSHRIWIELVQNESLAQTIALLAPELGEALLPAASRQRLIERARRLPPLPAAGFECRLGEQEMLVDLQQWVRGSTSDVDLLKRFVADAAHCPLHPDVGARLAALCDAWQDPACVLYDMLAEAWLEYDFVEASAGSETPAACPSIFIGLPQSLISPDERWAAVQCALDILMEGNWRAWREALLRTMVACPPEAFVSHVGAMLGRALPALRVNVKRLRPHTMARYLEMVNWPGEIAAAMAVAEKLFGFVDHITLCLDVGKQLYPRLGFECVLIAQSPTEPRWAVLLDYLVEEGLCTAAKRDGFLGWSGMTTPLLSDLDWPDHLIVESLIHPANHLSIIQRRFSHIKVIYVPGEPLSAKGYVGFAPHWMKL